MGQMAENSHKRNIINFVNTKSEKNVIDRIIVLLDNETRYCRKILVDIFEELAKKNIYHNAFDILAKNNRSDLIKWKIELMKKACAKGHVVILKMLLQDEKIYIGSMSDCIINASGKTNINIVALLVSKYDIYQITKPSINFINVINTIKEKIRKSTIPHTLVLNKLFLPEITNHIIYHMIQSSKWKQLIAYDPKNN